MGRREIQYHLPAIDPDPPNTPDELRLSNVSGLLSGQKHVIILGDVIVLLDLEHTSRLRLGRLIVSVPDGFPHVREWIE